MRMADAHWRQRRMQYRTALLRQFHAIAHQAPSGRRKRVSWSAVALLLFAGFFGMVHINAPHVLIDEVLSFGNIGGFEPPFSPAQVIETLNHHSPDHVPLWYIFASLAARVTGWSQAAMRAVSVLTSLLMFAFVYRFAAEAHQSGNGFGRAAIDGHKRSGFALYVSRPHVSAGDAAGCPACLGLLAAALPIRRRG